MQYLLYSMGDESVPTPPPTPELMAEMGRLIEETMRSGALVATGGLGPTAAGARVTSKGDEITVTDGPFSEAKELVGGFALINADSLEEAIQWATKFRKIVGDGESLVRPVFGPGD